MSTYSFKPDPNSRLSTQKNPDRTLRIIFVPWQKGTEEAKEWTEKSEQWNVAKPEKKFIILYHQPDVRGDAFLKRASTDKDAVIYIRGHGSPGANSLKANVGDEQRSLAITDVCQRLIDLGLEPSFPGAIKFHSCYSAVVYTDDSFAISHKAAERALKNSRDTKQYLTTGLPADLKQARDRLGQVNQELADEQAKWFWERDNNEVERLKEASRQRGIRVGELVQQQTQTAGADAYIRERELRVPTRESIASQGASYMRAQGFTHCSYFGYLGPMESLYAVDTSNPEQKAMHKFVTIEHLADPPAEIGELVEAKVINPKAVRASVVRMKIL